jgi:3-hydroxyisobutyrate dehydrogenase
MKVKAATLVETLAGREAAATFDIDSMRKDLRLILAEAAEGGFNLPVAETILVAFDEAAAAGWGQRDSAWIPAFWAAKASVAGG